MRLKIRAKLIVSFMVMVALIIALIAFALVSMGIISDSTRRLMYVQKKEALVSDLQVTIDRTVTALGDYLISGRKERRATFVQLAVFSKKQVEALEASLGNAGGGAADLEKKKIADLKFEMSRFDTSSREILSQADKLRKAGKHEVVRDLVASARKAIEGRGARGEAGTVRRDLEILRGLLEGGGKSADGRVEGIEFLSATVAESESRFRDLSLRLIDAKDRALERIAEIREITRREGETAVEMAVEAGRRARKVIMVGAVITLACGLILALFLANSFSRPILELERGARIIETGNFDYRLRLDTRDEIQDLAARFNAMAAALKSSYGELEEKVRARTRELQRLFDGISDGISVIDRKYRIVNANAGIAAMTGKGEGSLVGNTCHLAYNGSGSPCPGCPAEETFKSGTPSSVQIRWCTPGARPREMQISIFPLVEEEGRVMHVIEYAKDISETKALERTLFQSAKLAAIGTLAAGMAHEIRNPLGIMKASADMVRRNSREGEQNFELANFMIEEVDRLNRLVTRLLDFARPATLKSGHCDMNNILERALALVGPQYRIHDLEIVRDFAADLPPVRGDHAQLCQVFLNLIINAAQAMDGKGRLMLKTQQRGPGEVMASVSDSGHGIDEAILDSIFDPFFTTKEGGSGLGLSIVHRIVEAHGGRIELKSSPGKGTAFIVVVPSA